jgi:hypothetical protein
MPSWKFAPLISFDDAFRLLNASASAYTLRATTGGLLEAEVCIGKGRGKARGEPTARTITIALARAFGLDCDDKTRRHQTRHSGID